MDNDDSIIAREDRHCGPVPILLRAPNGVLQVLRVRHAPQRLMFQMGRRAFYYEIWGLADQVFVYKQVPLKG